MGGEVEIDLAPLGDGPGVGDGLGQHYCRRPDDTARQPRNNNKKRKRDSAQSSSMARDDTVGHFWGGPGTIVADTYQVERELGMGTFGRVLECSDLGRNGNRNCCDGG